MKIIKILFFLLLSSKSAIHASNADCVTRAEYETLLQRVNILEELLGNMNPEKIADAINSEKSDQKFYKSNSSFIENVVDVIHSREESAHHPWMKLEKWSKMKKGMKIAEVISILGTPSLDEPSLRKRVDAVYTYQGRRVSNGKMVKGKVRFYKNSVVDVEIPKLD